MWEERIEKKKFEEDFAEEIKEVYALTQDNAGSCHMEGECHWTVSMQLPAHIDGRTAKLKQEKKVLQWVLGRKKNKKPGKVFRLKEETIYRLKMRESLLKRTIWSNWEAPAGTCLLLVDVLEQGVKWSWLQELLREYQKPVFLSLPDTCQLQLNRSLSVLQGGGEWNVQKARILLDASGYDDKRVDKVLIVFRRPQKDVTA